MWVAIAALTFSLIAVIALNPETTGEAGANWVQAIVSTLAVAGAAWGVVFQHHLQIRRQTEEQQQLLLGARNMVALSRNKVLKLKNAFEKGVTGEHDLLTANADFAGHRWLLESMPVAQLATSGPAIATALAVSLSTIIRCQELVAALQEVRSNAMLPGEGDSNAKAWALSYAHHLSLYAEDIDNAMKRV